MEEEDIFAEDEYFEDTGDEVNMMEMIKSESASKNIKIYIIAVISLGKSIFNFFLNAKHS